MIFSIYMGLFNVKIDTRTFQEGPEKSFYFPMRTVRPTQHGPVTGPKPGVLPHVPYE